MKLFNDKKSQAGITALPLEIKVEIVMIVLFMIFSLALMASILQNNELVHRYFKKDVSMVQNSMILLPYDVNLLYLDHSGGKMSKLGFEIDKYFTSTLSERLGSKNSIKRHYIHFYNDVVPDNYGTTINKEMPLNFSKSNNVIKVSKQTENKNDIKECNDVLNLDYDNYQIIVNSNDYVFNTLSMNNKKLIKYNPNTIPLKNQIYVEILVNNEKSNEIFMTSKNNSVACNLYYKSDFNIYLIDSYVRNNFLSNYAEYVEFKISKEYFNEFIQDFNKIFR